MLVKLRFLTISTPQPGVFAIPWGYLFDAQAYCMDYGLDLDQISQDDIVAANHAAGKLQAGQWLMVRHTGSPNTPVPPAVVEHF